MSKVYSIRLDDVQVVVLEKLAEKKGISATKLLKEQLNDLWQVYNVCVSCGDIKLMEEFPVLNTGEQSCVCIDCMRNMVMDS